MDWSTFFTLLVQGTVVFLLAMGFYGAARSAHRREADKDAQARQAREGLRDKKMVEVTPDAPIARPGPQWHAQGKP